MEQNILLSMYESPPSKEEILVFTQDCVYRTLCQNLRLTRQSLGATNIRITGYIADKGSGPELELSPLTFPIFTQIQISKKLKSVFAMKSSSS